MKLRRGVGIGLLGVGLVVLSCSADRGVSAGLEPLVESQAAAARIAEVRARFRLRTPAATRFELASATHVHAVLSEEALRGVTRPAHVALPVRANDQVELEDDRSHLSLRFALDHVQNTRIEVAGGMALYRGALDGADVLHRVHAEGTEDYVVFATRPAREELSYSVDVSRVPGLRLVSNTLEFLDETGTPLLRVAPPYVVDAKGERHDAKLAVDGCAYDTRPAGPWGRQVTKPGAGRCVVRVAWRDVAYPAMVDPQWATTGSMATPRFAHTASVLASGRVLIAGGFNSGVTTTAELFDEGSGGAGTFAATGSMATARFRHTASVLLSGKVLVAGGATDLLGELYDPTGTGTFTTTGAMTTARSIHRASVLSSGKVLLAGGLVGSTALATAELFDPAGNGGAGTFAATGPMAVARGSHTMTVLPSGKVLAAGGNDGTTFIAGAETFDPAGNAGAGLFTAVGPMNTARSAFTASLLPSGKVLVLGGGNGSPNKLASAELFDPAGNAGAGTFAVVSTTMINARSGHAASLLPSGKVLVAGGSDLAPVNTAETFDPAGAGTFAATVPMASARAQHTMSVLPSGKVLVTGGVATGSVTSASAELYGGALGDACAANGDCLSRFCANGVCCSSACSGGGCDRCDLAGTMGTCSVAAARTPGANPGCAPYACDGVNAACPTSCSSDDVCPPAFYCAPTGTCEAEKERAAACDTQVDCKQPGCHECKSGFCVDGVCCDAKCDGNCLSCAASRKQSGAADGTCDTTKDGLTKGTFCGPTGTTCDGDHTTTSFDGTKDDCAPYKCENNGACRLTCRSVADCVAPTICDSAGSCVQPDAESDSGCSVVAARPRTARDTSTLLVLVACAIVLARRRRRGPTTSCTGPASPRAEADARSYRC